MHLKSNILWFIQNGSNWPEFWPWERQRQAWTITVPETWQLIEGYPCDIGLVCHHWAHQIGIFQFKNTCLTKVFWRKKIIIVIKKNHGQCIFWELASRYETSICFLFDGWDTETKSKWNCDKESACRTPNSTHKTKLLIITKLLTKVVRCNVQEY
jgi:hypothetical protein